MSLLTEFKEFALKGSVIDLAVGVIIGAAFGKIVSALVDNILMPFIGFFLGGMDFSSYSYVLKPAENGNPAITIGYGIFIQSIFYFIIMAFIVFLLVKFINNLHRNKEPETTAPTPSAEEKLLTEIRDLLKK